jgi:hypothetical protein
MVQVTPDGRVTRAEAAKYLGFSPKTLAEWHRLGLGPPSFKIGGRRFYWLADLCPYANGDTPVRPASPCIASTRGQ